MSKLEIGLEVMVLAFDGKAVKDGSEVTSDAYADAVAQGKSMSACDSIFVLTARANGCKLEKRGVKDFHLGDEIFDLL